MEIADDLGTVLGDYFRMADNPGVIKWWLKSKCRARPLLRKGRRKFK
jgi:hypothetical protein